MSFFVETIDFMVIISLGFWPLVILSYILLYQYDHTYDYCGYYCYTFLFLILTLLFHYFNSHNVLLVHPFIKIYRES